VSWGLWWFFVSTCIVADLTPGPAVMLVISNSVKYGPRPTVATICGSLLANIFYFAVCATSLGALLLSSSELFVAVKWLGAGYLVYLGIRALLSRETVLGLPKATAFVERSKWRFFLDGVLLQLSNPKALLWFGAIVPQFIDPRQDIPLQVLILGVMGTVTEFPILLGYAFLGGRAATLGPRYALWTNRVSGLFLLTVGGGLAMMRRD
jgi:homoserine/homoserine lactone efflux protein